MDNALHAFIHFNGPISIPSESTDESIKLPSKDWISILNFDLGAEQASGITGSHLDKDARRLNASLKQELKDLKKQKEEERLKKTHEHTIKELQKRAITQNTDMREFKMEMMEKRLELLKKKNAGPLGATDDDNKTGEFSFTKYADVATPLLHKEYIRLNRDINAAKNKPITEITVLIYIMKDGIPTLTTACAFQDCRLTELKISSEEDSPIIETISASYQRIYTYVKAGDSWISSRWDLIKGEEPSSPPIFDPTKQSA